MKLELIAPYFIQPINTLRALLKLKQQFIIISQVKFIYIALYHIYNLKGFFSELGLGLGRPRTDPIILIGRPQTPVILKVPQDIQPCAKSEKRFAHIQTQRSLV